MGGNKVCLEGKHLADVEVTAFFLRLRFLIDRFQSQKIAIGQQGVEFADNHDSKRRSRKATKEARKAQKEGRPAQMDLFFPRVYFMSSVWQIAIKQR